MSKQETHQPTLAILDGNENQVSTQTTVDLDKVKNLAEENNGTITAKMEGTDLVLGRAKPTPPKTLQEVIDLWTLEMNFQKRNACSKTLTDEGKRIAFAKWTTIRNMILHLKNLEA